MLWKEVTDFNDAFGDLRVDEVDEVLARDWDCWDVVAAHFLSIQMSEVLLSIFDLPFY